MEDMKKAVLEGFEKAYGTTDGVKAYFAAGRVNLIGEHTDYNAGHVFPCALTIGTYGAARRRDDNKMRFISLNYSDAKVIETSLEDLNPSEEAGWTNYPKGVVWAFEKRGFKLPCGFDMAIYGNIPAGSGLSSSASLEVLTGFILRDLYGFEVSNQDLALIGQYSENNYNGCNCGIMDQFAVAMGKENNAIFLDTADLSFEYALSFYGLIPERVTLYTSATTCKNRTKKFTNEFGTYTYQDIPLIAYPHETMVQVWNNRGYLIATPEKALCDTLCKQKPVTSLKALKQLLFDNLRIDEDEFEKLNREALLFLCPLYKKKNLNFLCRLLEKEGKQ